MMTTGVSKRQLKGDTRLSAVHEGRHKYRCIRILHTVLIQYNLKIGLLVFTEIFIQGRRHPLDSPNRIRVSLPVVFSIYK